MITLQADNRILKSRNANRRRLIAVDIENIVGGAVLSSAAAMSARNEIEARLGICDDEIVVVGTSHIGALNTKGAWGSARVVWGSGPDGADLALLREMDADWIADRFEELVLVSGDNIFSDLVYRVAHKGVPVTVVARDGHCSTRLRMVATDTMLLLPPNDLIGEAA